MDIENLKRAAEINERIEDYQSALKNLESDGARIWVAKDSRINSISIVCLYEDSFLKDLRRLIDEHVAALLEESKTL